MAVVGIVGAVGAGRLHGAPCTSIEPEPEPLPGAYDGGQIARGAKFGVLGNQEMINVPFSMTSYTSKAIEDQQAHSIGDLLSHDPAVRPAFGFGNRPLATSSTFTICPLRVDS